MMLKKYLLPILFFFNFLNAAAEPEQLKAARDFSQNVYYALPGLVNLADADENHKSSLPSAGNLLVIPLDYSIQYGGEEYSYLTVTGDNRIFLGDLPEGYTLPNMGEGVRPYVVPTEKVLQPVTGNTDIPIRWKTFSERGDQYTAIEVGPLYIEGQDDSLSYQVLFYTDGEIQVQFWNHKRDKAYIQSPIEHFSFSEGIYIDFPYVFNGSTKIETIQKKIYSTGSVPVFENGKLHPGWIAKSFDGQGVKYDVIDNELDVDFGTQKSAGGLLAYDYSREHPIVGSFNVLSIDAYSVSFGDGKNESTAIPVFFWYFKETIALSYQANYPYFKNSSLFEFGNAFSDQKFLAQNGYPTTIGKCLAVASDGTSRIWPCAYYWQSWNTACEKGLNPDTIIAPAIKMQTSDNAENRHIRIKSVRLAPRQPLSVQFLPPPTHKLTYDGGGSGYLEIGSRKAPMDLIDGASVNAEIHSTPGKTISQIYVNNQLAFENGNQLLEGFSITYDESTNIASFTMDAIYCDISIKVIFEKCETRNLAAVIPAYEKTEIFLDPSNSLRKVESYSVKDGFGRVVQTQVPLNNGSFKISALYLDNAGNTEFAPMAYIVSKQTYSYEDMYCKQCIVNSAAYYNGADNVEIERKNSFGYPYSEEDRHYGEDSAIVSTVAGVGEASFALGDKFAKQWRLPVKTNTSSEFFTEKQLVNDKELEYSYRTRKNDIENNSNEYPYTLTVNLSFDGVYTQQLADGAGNLMATRSSHNNESLVTRYEYNTASQLVKTYIENHSGFQTTYVYDDAGRLIATTSPDKGLVETKYDSFDRVRFTRDARQKARGADYFTAVVYDSQDRIVQTGEVRGGHSFSAPDAVISTTALHLFSETIYGKPSVAVLLAKGVTTDQAMLENIVGSMNGILLNDVGAVLSYDGNGNVITLKLSSYDRLGRKEKQWIIYGVEDGVPALELNYVYNVSNELTESRLSEWNGSGWEQKSKRNRSYDNFGRLTSVTENDQPLAKYERNGNGTLLESKTYDKGTLVYGKKTDSDIYGRMTSITYKDASGKTLYGQALTYGTPLLGRLAGAEHSWAAGRHSTESYDYDDIGHLTSFASDNDRLKPSSYAYDLLGRLTQKIENDTTLQYSYANGSYRPNSMEVNGSTISNILEYDASGKVWLDRHHKVAYTLNALGLPERVALYKSDAELPQDISLKDADDKKIYDEEYGNIEMAYDEGGTRIWERRYTRGGYIGSDVTIPGIGIYKKTQLHSFTLTRLDLVNGGYRAGENGSAYFPVTDVQGNVRGYASTTGLESAYAYYPFGTTVELTETATADERRWQSKEYDGEHGKYYFGARYFDPFFGLWMSPDPAGQYANPYTYGGDPLNYADPTGMLAGNIFPGVVVGWDQQHGWSVGIGVAFGKDYNTSYSWNQDGSNSFNLSGNVKVPIPYTTLVMNFGGGYSYNSYSGHALTTQTGICSGFAEVACAGTEVGGGLYWDRNGNFMGATVYAENYVEVTGDKFSARVSNGYEWGFMGMEGRGLYAGANVEGLYAEYSQNGGWNYGASGMLQIAEYDPEHPSGYKRSTLEKAYQAQLACEPTRDCEVDFTRDEVLGVVTREDDGSYHHYDFDGDDAHTHQSTTKYNSRTSVDKPSNVDGSLAYQRDPYDLNGHYVLLTKTKQLVQYGKINKMQYQLTQDDNAPIIHTWNIDDRIGWKLNIRWRSLR